MKQSIMNLITTVLLTSLLAGCTEPTTSKPISTKDGESVKHTSEASETTGTQNDGLTTELPGKSDDTSGGLPTIESTVILDQDGVKITAQSLVDESIWGLGVKLLIENNTDQDLVFSSEYLVVNNYMISDLFAKTVAAGKKANEVLSLSTSGLEEAGITEAGEIAFSLRVYDDETWDDLLQTDEIVLHTSAYQADSALALDEGKELLNTDGVRIVGRYLTEDSFWGAGVQLFIENTSDLAVTVGCEDFSINGFMVSSFFSATVNPGRYSLEEITIFDSDLKDNEIDTIEEIELSLRISDSDTYDLIHQSPPISFSVE